MKTQLKLEDGLHLTILPFKNLEFAGEFHWLSIVVKVSLRDICMLWVALYRMIVKQPVTTLQSKIIEKEVHADIQFLVFNPLKRWTI